MRTRSTSRHQMRARVRNVRLRSAAPRRPAGAISGEKDAGSLTRRPPPARADRSGHATPPSASAATVAENASPRFSKSRNWSKLAQAGDSSTTSPGLARSIARRTASHSISQRWTGTCGSSRSAKRAAGLADRVGFFHVAQRVAAFAQPVLLRQPARRSSARARPVRVERPPARARRRRGWSPCCR